MLDGLETGERGASVGEEAVNEARTNFEGKQAELQQKNSDFDNAKTQKVQLPEITLEDLMSMTGKCVVDQEDDLIKDARKVYTDALQQAGEAQEAVNHAKEALDKAEQNAQREQQECYCEDKQNLEKIWTVSNAALPQQNQEYAKAKQLECALDAKEEDCEVEQ